MTDRAGHGFVIAVYPNTNGISFTVFEGAASLVDWGGRGAGYKHSRDRLLNNVSILVEKYQPATLVLQNMNRRGTSRSPRIRTLNAEIAALAKSRRIPVCSYARIEVQKAFAPLGPITKVGIAETIAKQIPALERLVPPPRKPWHSEPRRMGIFDAAALAMTFFYTRPDIQKQT
jgi:hypothetical protein